MGSTMSARYFRFLGLLVYLLLNYLLEFQLAFGFGMQRKLQHALVSGPLKFLAVLALAYLLIFVVGRKAQVLKAVTLDFIPLRLISLDGHYVTRWIKLREEPTYPFDEPTVLPLFQRPPPIS